MASKVTVKSRFPAIAAQLPWKVRAAAGAGAELIAESAADKVPDRPPIGKGLVEAIHVESEPEGYYVVAGDDEHFYGHFLEFGTTHAGARPFLLPAFEERKSEVIGMVQATLKTL